MIEAGSITAGGIAGRRGINPTSPAAIFHEKKSMTSRLKDFESELETLGEDEDRKRVDLLNRLGWELIPVDIGRSHQLSLETIDLARGISYPRGIAHALVNQAGHDFFMAEYETAMDKLHQALATFETENDSTGKGNASFFQGLIHWSLGDYEWAVECLHRSEQFAHDAGSAENEGWALTSLGGVYEATGDMDSAIGCHARSFVLFRKVGYVLGEARALSGLGMIFQRQGRYEAALEQHLESLRLYRETSSELSEARAMNDIGMIYQELGDTARALECLNRALEIRRRFRNRPAEITTLLNLGKLYCQEGNVPQALAHLSRALTIATEAGTRPKLYQTHQTLSETYERAGDYERALYHQRSSQRVKEEVFSDESKTRLKNLQIRFELEKAEKEAEIQRLRNVELAEAMEQLKQAQAQLIESEKMAALGKLVAGVAHEVNTPVGVIKGSMGVCASALEMIVHELENTHRIEDIRESRTLARATEALRSSIDVTSSSGHRIEKIVKSLKNFTRLDQAEFQTTDIHEGIESTLSLLEPQWGERIRVVKRFRDLPKIQCYSSALNQVFMTLLVNASEAIESDGTITITTEKGDDCIRILISDDGCGIPLEKLERIFEIGFSRKGNQMRMHTGLASVYGVVKKHSGHVEARSEPKCGTTFEISLPVSQSD